MQRCTARAAGGTINRLKPGPATVFSRSRNEDDISGQILFFGCARQDICGAAQYALFPAPLSPPAFAGWPINVRIGSHSLGGLRVARGSLLEKLKTVTLGNGRKPGNP